MTVYVFYRFMVLLFVAQENLVGIFASMLFCIRCGLSCHILSLANKNINLFSISVLSNIIKMSYLQVYQEVLIIF